MEKFDVVIIGSGPGGYVAAIRAGQLGLKTAIVEKDKELGGTCLNIGCIPSKALLTSSDHFVFAQKEASKHGIKLDNVQLDLAVMLAAQGQGRENPYRRCSPAHEVEQGDDFRRDGNNHRAREKFPFKSSKGETQEIETKNIVIATGSVPVELPFAKFDGKTIVSTTEALCFEKPPEKLLVIGARRDRPGARLGLEPARLGSHRPRIPAAHRDSASISSFRICCSGFLTKQGMKFHLETKVTAVKAAEGGATVTATKGAEELKFEADKVLVSVGRRAFADGVLEEKSALSWTTESASRWTNTSRQTWTAFLRSAMSSPAPCLRTRRRKRGSRAWKTSQANPVM